jgi:hypothetical protein
MGMVTKSEGGGEIRRPKRGPGLQEETIYYMEEDGASRAGESVGVKESTAPAGQAVANVNTQIDKSILRARSTRIGELYDDDC